MQNPLWARQTKSGFQGSDPPRLVGFIYITHPHNTIIISKKHHEKMNGNFQHADMTSSTMPQLAGWPWLPRLNVNKPLYSK